MMYRHNIEARSTKPYRTRRQKRQYKRIVMLIFLAIVVGTIYGFYHKENKKENSPIDGIVLSSHKQESTSNTIERVRLDRSQIPPLDFQTIKYHEIFNDTNATQLDAAMRNGLRDPDKVTDPSKSNELIKIETNEWYVVDSMYFSKPYLRPEAALMVQLIGMRFQELMQEYYPNKHYNIIVTSALRNSESVAQLRKRNRNATEYSCHIFGTTVDITYSRFRNDNGVDENELYLKQMLAQALYELRYEGLIYVKYEHRQSCFHLTLRNTEYKGHQKSQRVSYPCPANWETIPSNTHSVSEKSFFHKKTDSKINDNDQLSARKLRKIQRQQKKLEKAQQRAKQKAVRKLNKKKEEQVTISDSPQQESVQTEPKVKVVRIEEQPTSRTSNLPEPPKRKSTRLVGYDF